MHLDKQDIEDDARVEIVQLRSILSKLIEDREWADVS
jgi:hypothetical protein